MIKRWIVNNWIRLVDIKDKVWDWCVNSLHLIKDALINWDSQFYEFVDEGRYMVGKVFDFLYMAVSKIRYVIGEFTKLIRELLNSLGGGWK